MKNPPQNSNQKILELRNKFTKGDPDTEKQVDEIVDVLRGGFKINPSFAKEQFTLLNRDLAEDNYQSFLDKSDAIKAQKPEQKDYFLELFKNVAEVIINHQSQDFDDEEKVEILEELRGNFAFLGSEQKYDSDQAIISFLKTLILSEEVEEELQKKIAVVIGASIKSTSQVDLDSSEDISDKAVEGSIIVESVNAVQKALVPRNLIESTEEVENELGLSDIDLEEKVETEIDDEEVEIDDEEEIEEVKKKQEEEEAEKKKKEEEQKKTNQQNDSQNQSPKPEKKQSIWEAFKAAMSSITFDTVKKGAASLVLYSFVYGLAVASTGPFAPVIALAAVGFFFKATEKPQEVKKDENKQPKEVSLKELEEYQKEVEEIRGKVRSDKDLAVVSEDLKKNEEIEAIKKGLAKQIVPTENINPNINSNLPKNPQSKAVDRQ